jgi:hypothetical protein
MLPGVGPECSRAKIEQAARVVQESDRHRSWRGHSSRQDRASGDRLTEVRLKPLPSGHREIDVEQQLGERD